MIVKVKKFQKVVRDIQKKKHISNEKLSEIMNLDYSYIFRIFKENTGYGLKIISGIEKFCKYFDIDSKEFIFLE